jgi:hypothetical protein
MTASLENRQQLSSSNEQERLRRETDTQQLVETIIGRHGEFFADPNNRLEFMRSQDADGFLRIAQHVNAKLRGEIPGVLRRDENQKGAFLPAMHTPSHEDKIPAFRKGYRAIQEYITDSADPIDKKITGVAMATEALVIWTHPFNDGNGRTSRFLAKLIEEGGVDINGLVEETASGSRRNRVYNQILETKESVLASADNEDLLFDEDEREGMRLRAQNLPGDVDGIYLSVQRLLQNDAVRQNTLRRAHVKQPAA